MLGVLKAGGVYVPIDPASPGERTALMVEDIDPIVILTQAQFAAQFDTRGPSVIAVDVLDFPDAMPSGPANAVSAENLAYIMFTSGSTGRPKGVCICHRGVARLVTGQTYFESGPGHRFLQSAPLTFDASTFEIWGALLHGAELVLYPERRLSIDGIRKIIEKAGISTLWLTPSLFNPLVDADPHILGTVTQLILGGEPLSPSHVSRALAALPQLQIINGYGPTENSDFTCCYRVPPEFRGEAPSVPVGRPLRGDQIYILDADLRPVAEGEAGELCVSGVGLARGYHRRPGQTARSFVPNPFSRDPGGRLYRTGDLATLGKDGNISLLGRVDDQVKIRGFRIELNEVSTAVLRHPLVRAAAVLSRKDAADISSLVAYAQLIDDRELTISSLRDFLAAMLPDYMLPSALIIVDVMPLNAHGKIDRAALVTRKQSVERPKQASDYLAPANRMERLVADVWSGVLGVSPVGALDNFFDLGGTSLLTYQIQVALQDGLGRPISATTFFEFVTVRSLAEQLRLQDEPTAVPDPTGREVRDIGSAEKLQARVQQRLKMRRPRFLSGG